MPRLILFLVVLLVAVIIDTPVIEALRMAPPWLAEIASRITWVGNTGWMAIVLLVAALALAVNRPDPESAARADALLRLVTACFLLILLTGLAVQGLKHAFGRPRPGVLGELSPLTLSPFGFQRGWNAFPSGHSTTMGALAMLCTRLWPRAWPIAFAVAVMIGVSRVLVGKHYPSDVVAGLALGAVLAAWMLGRWQAAGVLELSVFSNPRLLPRAGLGPLSGLRAIPRAIADQIGALWRRPDGSPT